MKLDANDPPSPQLKQQLATTMIEFVQETYRDGLTKIAKIEVRIDFKSGDMIGFERKSK